MKHKHLWGVVVGQPTNEHFEKEKIINGTSMLAGNIGLWVMAGVGDTQGARGETLFYTRKAAREEAKYHMSKNKFWLYHAKKFG